MKSKCKTCLYKSDSEITICPICKIDKTKVKKELTKEEKKIRQACRCIRGFGRFEILLASFCILFLLTPSLNKDNFFMIPFLVVALVCIVLGFGLYFYKKWSFYLHIILCIYFIVSCFIISIYWGLIYPLIISYYLFNRRAINVFLKQKKK